jgi:hypothetical protein
LAAEQADHGTVLSFLFLALSEPAPVLTSAGPWTSCKAQWEFDERWNLLLAAHCSHSSHQTPMDCYACFLADWRSLYSAVLSWMADFDPLIVLERAEEKVECESTIGRCPALNENE